VRLGAGAVVVCEGAVVLVGAVCGWRVMVGVMGGWMRWFEWGVIGAGWEGVRLAGWGL